MNDPLSSTASAASLLDPRNAIDHISRDELVNLAVDDAIERIEAEKKRLNELANEHDALAMEDMKHFYADLRGQALRLTAPYVKNFKKLAAGMGYRKAVVSVWPLPQAGDINVNGRYFYDPEDHRGLNHSSDKHDSISLVSFASARLHEKTLEKRSVYVDLTAVQEDRSAGGRLNASIRFRIDPSKLVVDDALLARIRQNWALADEAKTAWGKLQDASAPETLRRKGLATLTRKALERLGITLDVARIDIPLLSDSST